MSANEFVISIVGKEALVHVLDYILALSKQKTMADGIWQSFTI